jgi:hypothetical protein
VERLSGLSAEFGAAEDNTFMKELRCELLRCQRGRLRVARHAVMKEHSRSGSRAPWLPPASYVIGECLCSDQQRFSGRRRSDHWRDGCAASSVLCNAAICHPSGSLVSTKVNRAACRLARGP